MWKANSRKCLDPIFQLFSTVHVWKQLQFSITWGSGWYLFTAGCRSFEKSFWLWNQTPPPNTHTDTHSNTSSSMRNEGQTCVRVGAVWQNEDQATGKKIKQDRSSPHTSIYSATVIILTLSTNTHTCTHTWIKVCVCQIPGAERCVFEHGSLLKCLIRPVFEQEETATYQHAAGKRPITALARLAEGFCIYLADTHLHHACLHKDTQRDTLTDRKDGQHTCTHTHTPSGFLTTVH